jgi:hypothetical protein
LVQDLYAQRYRSEDVPHPMAMLSLPTSDLMPSARRNRHC